MLDAARMPTRHTGLVRIPLPIVISFLLLAAMVLGSLFVAGRTSDGIKATAEAWQYRKAVTDLGIFMRDAEIGQRGVLLTGKPKYLEPYRQGVSRVDDALREISAGMGVRGRDAAARLRPIVAARLAEMAQTLELADAGRRDDAIALIRTDRGRNLMLEIRSITEREREWMTGHADALADTALADVRRLTVGLIAGSLLVVLMLLLWLAKARQQLADTDRARAEAEAAFAALKSESESREAAESQVRHLQKMESLGQLTGGIAHDFNNMLAVVLGGIDLAKKKLKSDPARAENLLDNAREGAMRAATLTSRLLAFSRNQPLAPASLDVNTLVGGMCDMLNRTLGDQIKVECVYAAGLWRCYADPSEVENVILNLAVNARDAMAGGGKLTVETANAHIDDNYANARSDVAAGQYVLICVSDTGMGMPQDIVDRAFDPFFTTKAVGKGTGLGLSQVFGFAKQSGGHSAIYSEVGQGTTVKVYLPRFTGADPAQLATTPSDAVPEGHSSEMILVVEDEQRLRHFAVDALRELGYIAISAATPAEALVALNEQPNITMMFTDIVMPEMSGRQLADAALKMRPGLPILFTTGYTRNAIVHNGMVDIGVAFLAKPYGIGELARKIRDVLDGGGVNRSV